LQLFLFFSLSLGSEPCPTSKMGEEKRKRKKKRRTFSLLGD